MAKLTTLQWRNDNLEGLTRYKLNALGPRPDKVELLPSGLIENISMLVSLASEVPFFEDNNTQLGTWDAVFLRDILVRFAVIAAWEIEDDIDATSALFDQYDQLHQDCVTAAGCMDPRPRREEVDDQFLVLFSNLFEIIDGLSVLPDRFEDDLGAEVDFSRAISMVLPKAVSDLSIIFGEFFPNGETLPPEVLMDKMKAYGINASDLQLQDGAPDRQRYLQKKRFIEVEQSLYRLQKDCAKLARDHFNRLIASDYNPQPHISLVLAFFQMYERLAGQINALPLQYLSYFYYDWLGQAPKAASPDKLDIFVEPSEAGKGSELPAGTAFKCGKDANGQDIQYLSKRNTFLSGAAITALESVAISTDARNRLRIKKSDVLDKDGAWPLLSDKNEADQGDLASFRITGPVLDLKEGERNLEFQLNLESQTAEECQALVSIFAKNNVGQNSNELQRFLCARASTAEGFRIIASSDINASLQAVDENNVRLILSLSIPPEFPAMTLCDGMEAPSIEFYPANDSIDIHTPPFLNAVITRLVLRLNAKNQKENFTYGEGGAKAPVAQIMPFGIPPQNGGGVYLSNGVFKTGVAIKSVKLNWRWLGMPNSLIHYFAAYYRKLTKSQNERCYYHLEARLDVEDDFIEALQQETLLEGLSTTSVELASQDKLDQGYPARGVSLKLKAPHFAMGHAHYGQLMAEATREDAQRKIFSLLWQSLRAGIKAILIPLIIRVPDSYLKIDEVNKVGEKLDFEEKQRKWRIGPLTLIRRFRKFRRIPATLNIQPPCDVQMADISMDIVGEVDLDFTEGTCSQALSFEHVYPGGVKKFEHSGKACVTLFPSIPTGREFHIGIDDLTVGQPVSFLWHIPCSTAQSHEGQQQVEWSILDGDIWRNLTDKDILWDETDSLSHSGTICFRLPAADLSSNNIMRSGSYWLRARVSGKPTMERRCMGIFLNGVSLEHNSLTSVPVQAIKPKTVKALVRKLPSIAKIQQPYVSYGGQSAEAEKDFFQRVSRDLSSRRRLVSSDNIEKAVLERFPEIESVKCLNATMPNGVKAPGHMTVVIATRAVRDDGVLKIFVPPITCAEVGKYLNAKIPFSGTLHVIPPVEEHLKIKATLDLGQYADPLRWKQLATTALQDAIYEATIFHGNATIYGCVEHELLTSTLKHLPFVNRISELSVIVGGDISASPGGYYRPSHPGGVLVSASVFDLHAFDTPMASSTKIGGVDGY